MNHNSFRYYVLLFHDMNVSRLNLKSHNNRHTLFQNDFVLFLHYTFLDKHETYSGTQKIIGKPVHSAMWNMICTVSSTHPLWESYAMLINLRKPLVKQQSNMYPLLYISLINKTNTCVNT